jgi:hypothetical protein
MQFLELIQNKTKCSQKKETLQNLFSNMQWKAKQKCTFPEFKRDFFFKIENTEDAMNVSK